MRLATKTTEVFTFHELTPRAQERALEKQFEFEMSFDWYDCVYDDAEMVGIKINSFDIDRGSYCNITVRDTYETVQLIMANHGPTCDTYKLALTFLHDRDNLVETAPKDADGEFENEHALDKALDELDREFVNQLAEEYRIILQKEYEYRSSSEYLVECIEANEYEFDCKGNIYA